LDSTFQYIFHHFPSLHLLPKSQIDYIFLLFVSSKNFHQFDSFTQTWLFFFKSRKCIINLTKYKSWLQRASSFRGHFYGTRLQNSLLLLFSTIFWLGRWIFWLSPISYLKSNTMAALQRDDDIFTCFLFHFLLWNEFPSSLLY